MAPASRSWARLASVAVTSVAFADGVGGAEGAADGGAGLGGAGTGDRPSLASITCCLNSSTCWTEVNASAPTRPEDDMILISPYPSDRPSTDVSSCTSLMDASIVSVLRRRISPSRPSTRRFVTEYDAVRQATML